VSEADGLRSVEEGLAVGVAVSIEGAVPVADAVSLLPVAFGETGVPAGDASVAAAGACGGAVTVG
jgi:hypothetical protein